MDDHSARLHTLQRLTRKITATLAVEALYRAIYESTHELMDCDAFFIALQDEARQVCDYVFQIENDVRLPPVQLPLADGLASRVIRTRQLVDYANLNGTPPFPIQHWGGKHQARSVLCVPMIFGNRVLGALSAQSYRPNAYSDADREILSIFAGQAAVAIHNARLFAETQRKIRQLALLNQVGHIISSTIEIGHLLDLIYEQVRQVLPSDTYYVTLVNWENQTLELRVLVDEGEHFPATQIQLGEGLASLVVQRRAPLILHNLPEDYGRLGIIRIPAGRSKPSLSWLGVPMIASERLIGVLALASYHPAAFDEEDAEVLQNIATLAAIAIDNARHHARAEEQARLDSLTQVLNHGYFLMRLREEVTGALATAHRLSVIMLDIDHFKEYNDAYGHLAGDAILRGTVQAIRSSIHQADLVGRWGGEEFAIALLETDQAGALSVADRIRATLAQLNLTDDQGRAVPVPTASQGIATLPEDGEDAIALIDRADQRLYQAKARGRDQISGTGG
jgi:diguanylate cyclase (GGDEF)-like protein